MSGHAFEPVIWRGKAAEERSKRVRLRYPLRARLERRSNWNWNKWVRQTHRWLSIAFTVGVIVNFVALRLKKYNVWVGLSAGLPLALQPFTGLYLFVPPYATRWGSGQRTA